MTSQEKENLIRWIWRVIITIILVGITTASICGVALALYIDRYITKDLDIDLNNFGLDFTSFVYYTDPQTGESKKLEALHNTENRVWVNLSDIPQDLQDAFISIEDTRFLKHHGVDWKRTIGATLSWTGLLGNFSGGGSTITQQLIKNITGDDEVSVKRKIQEIFRALELEKKYTKEQILEMYLNTIFLGQNFNGVQTAAQGYFGKDVSELSLAECASIAGITKYPYKYDPFRHPEYNKERQEVILNQMCKNGKISEEERDAAKAETLVFVEKNSSSGTAQAQSYFVDQVIEDVLDDLVNEKGYSRKLATNLLYTGGLSIYSTINPDVQNKMDAVFTNEANFPKVKGKDGSLPQAAMVVIDPYTGNVVAMRGGRGEKTAARILNRATQTYRSPGSAIKPLSVYAPSIEYGLIKMSSVMDDVPIDFKTNSKGWPKNYYTNSSNPNNSGYYGRMSIIQAVEISNNTIPAQLIKELTPERAYAFLTANLGITTLIKSQTTSTGKVISDIMGPASLSLGGLTKGMSVLELTAAYCPFVNGGVYIKPRTYTKVVDSSGAVILEKEQESNVAMSEKTAGSVLALLQNVVSGSSGTGRRAKITGIATAGKTGTTTDDKDRWFVGLTPYYVGAVWFGYDMQQTVKNVSGNPALNLWKGVMDSVHKPLKNRDFSFPDNFVTVEFCRDSGQLATEWCKSDPRGSRVTSFKMAPEDKPTESCTMHIPVKVDTVTKMAATDNCPSSNVKTVGLINTTRIFKIYGIHVNDEGYTAPDIFSMFSAAKDVLTAKISSGELEGYPALPSSSSANYGAYCTAHGGTPSGASGDHSPVTGGGSQSNTSSANAQEQGTGSTISENELALAHEIEAALYGD